MQSRLLASFATVATLAVFAGAAGAQQPAAPTHPVHETQAQLRRAAKISIDSARAVARRTVPNARIASSELEREKGRLIYSFDMRVAGKKGVEEVNVDAMTGELVAHEHESAAAERAEAKSEAKEKPAKP